MCCLGMVIMKEYLGVKLVALLSERSKHEVLNKGVKLRKQPVDLTEGEEAAWRVLAGF